MSGGVFADVVFSGIVYEEHLGGDVVGDVDVVVSCGDVVLAKSYSDGAYSVNFSDADCVDGGLAVFGFSRDGFEDLEFSSVVDYSEMWIFDFGESILRSDVFNVVMNRGGEVRRGGECRELFLDCTFWSSCVDGIEMRTCSSNCEVNKNEVRGCGGEPLFLTGSGDFEILEL